MIMQIQLRLDAALTYNDFSLLQLSRIKYSNAPFKGGRAALRSNSTKR